MPLWQTEPAQNQNLQKLVEDFTVGNDYILDLELIPYDVQASKVHARALKKIIPPPPLWPR